MIKVLRLSMECIDKVVIGSMMQLLHQMVTYGGRDFTWCLKTRDMLITRAI